METFRFFKGDAFAADMVLPDSFDAGNSGQTAQPSRDPRPGILWLLLGEALPGQKGGLGRGAEEGWDPTRGSKVRQVEV